MLDAIRTFLDDTDLPPGTHLLVGCSGGPDSTALLYALGLLRSEYGFSLSVATYDHRLRDRSEVALEVDLVSHHCESLGFMLHTGSAKDGEVRETARNNRIGVEAAARFHRFAFLNEIAAKLSCSHIVLGHNRGDQIETQVQRIFQGSGPEGLVGISPARGNILRPLLSIERTSILEFLRNRGIEFAIESSNSDTNILRNAVRLELLPHMQKAFPGFESSLEVFSEKMGLVNEFLKTESESRIPLRYDDHANEAILPTIAFDAAPRIVKLTSLMRACDLVHEKLSIIPQRVPYKMLRKMLALPISRASGPKTLVQTKKIEIIREAHSIRVRPRVVLDIENSYLIVVNSGGSQDLTLRISEMVILVSNHVSCDSQSVRVPASEYPILVRSKRSGDRIIRQGASVSIKDLFDGWAIAPRFRWGVPIVENRNGILAVLGKSFGGRNWIAGTVDQSSEGAYDTLNISVTLKV